MHFYKKWDGIERILLDFIFENNYLPKLWVIGCLTQQQFARIEIYSASYFAASIIRKDFTKNKYNKFPEKWFV